MRSRSRLTIPPPVYFTLAFLAGLGLHRVMPLALPPAGWLRALGWLLAGAAALIAVIAIATLIRARTPIHPGAEARALVTYGPFAYSRNPMYVSLVTLYAGLSLAFGLLWPLFILPIAIWIVSSVVIRAEEALLTKIFGATYTTYRQRVRRWV